jgi:putative transcriptional regulator
MVDDDSPDWDERNIDSLDLAGKVKVTRAWLSLTQSDDAALLRVPVATLRNWEQRRSVPAGPARTLIDLVYRDPKECGESWRTRRRDRAGQGQG